MIDIGTPYCTDRLMVPTSRVTRVTRSPLLALSTRPSGRERIVRTMYSRADDNRSWPNTVDVRWARNVSSAWVQTTATISTARALSDEPASPATVRLIREPSRRGTTSPVAGREAVEHHQQREHLLALAQQRLEEVQHRLVVGDRPAAVGLAGLGVVLQRPALAQGVPAPQGGDPVGERALRRRCRARAGSREARRPGRARCRVRWTAGQPRVLTSSHRWSGGPSRPVARPGDGTTRRRPSRA